MPFRHEVRVRRCAWVVDWPWRLATCRTGDGRSPRRSDLEHPHAETPTAACAAVGVSSQSPIRFRRINPSDSGDRIAAPIARPLSYRALNSRCSCAGCRLPSSRHCCRQPVTVTSGVATANRYRSRKSSVSRCRQVRLPRLASGLLRLPVRFRGPRCFSTYTLNHCA